MYIPLLYCTVLYCAFRSRISSCFEKNSIFRVGPWHCRIIGVGATVAVSCCRYRDIGTPAFPARPDTPVDRFLGAPVKLTQFKSPDISEKKCLFTAVWKTRLLKKKRFSLDSMHISLFKKTFELAMKCLIRDSVGLFRVGVWGFLRERYWTNLTNFEAPSL